MPRYLTSQEWLEQSALLLEARPSTTRITTRYSIKAGKARSTKATTDGEQQQQSSAAALPPPRGRLVLRTQDSATGVCLRYKTTKAAEVSRLIQMLGSLGRRMAGLPPRDDGLSNEAEPAAATAPAAVEAPVTSSAAPAAGGQQQQAGSSGGPGGGGAKQKKKKKR